MDEALILQCSRFFREANLRNLDTFASRTLRFLIFLVALMEHSRAREFELTCRRVQARLNALGGCREWLTSRVSASSKLSTC
jgi:hypothetical protein